MGSLDWWKDRSLIWETGDPHIYLRSTADHRVLVGCEDDRVLNPERAIGRFRSRRHVWFGSSESSSRRFNWSLPLAGLDCLEAPKTVWPTLAPTPRFPARISPWDSAVTELLLAKLRPAYLPVSFLVANTLTKTYSALIASCCGDNKVLFIAILSLRATSHYSTRRGKGLRTSFGPQRTCRVISGAQPRLQRLFPAPTHFVTILQTSNFS